MLMHRKSKFYRLLISESFLIYMDQFDTKTNNTQKVFYYKMVAKSVGKMYSIYDGKTEYALGQSMYQEARE